MFFIHTLFNDEGLKRIFLITRVIKIYEVITECL